MKARSLTDRILDRLIELTLIILCAGTVAVAMRVGQLSPSTVARAMSNAEAFKAKCETDSECVSKFGLELDASGPLENK